MKVRWWAIVILVAIAVAYVFVIHLRRAGLSARSLPPAWEALTATQIRRWTVPAAARKLANPIAATSETLARGRAHWADHCATCHANNGSGETEMGRNLYPKAPDMRTAGTQSLTDGDLYYIIRNGVPLTGMPAWGDPSLGDNDSETWMLVSFIRRLPSLTPEEEAAMEKLNPKSTMEREEEQEEEDFLNGKTPMENGHAH